MLAELSQQDLREKSYYLAHDFHQNLENILRKKFSYDLALAGDATLHSEYEKSIRRTAKTPREMMGKAECEIVGIAFYKYFGEFTAIQRMAEEWCRRYHTSREILEQHSTIGVGIAIDENEKVIYLTARFR